MADINKKLGKRIRALRKAKGITQEQLAYDAHTDYSYLNEIEAGKRSPSVEKIQAIARALKVPLKDLLK